MAAWQLSDRKDGDRDREDENIGPMASSVLDATAKIATQKIQSYASLKEKVLGDYECIFVQIGTELYIKQ